MFSTLLESKGHRTKRTAGSVFSVVAHAAIVGAMVAATANATVRTENDPQETHIRFVPPPPSPPTPATPASTPSTAPEVFTDAAPTLGAPALDVPLDVPTGIPPVDLSRAATNADDFATGRRGIASGIPGGSATATSAGYYFAGQVEKPVMALPGTAGPVFPDLLRTSGVEGHLLAEFVVDTSGTARLETLRVLASDHALFTNAVKQALGRMRFLPAEVGGRKVPQLVQQTFQFTLQH